jgi:hypothetical protein
MLLQTISSRNSSLQRPRILAVFNVQSSYNARRTQVQLLVDSYLLIFSVLPKFSIRANDPILSYLVADEMTKV